jgi:Na+/H+ antiporter NhaD/arsenite permease-like protein
VRAAFAVAARSSSEYPRSYTEKMGFERRFRNLYLFANAFIAMGVFAILGSLMVPVDWRGIAQGLSGVSGACAFWSLVESERDKPASGRRRHVELGAVILSIALFLSSFLGSEFRLDLLLWLVMPASYLWRSCRVTSKDGIGTEGR